MLKLVYTAGAKEEMSAFSKLTFTEKRNLVFRVSFRKRRFLDLANGVVMPNTILLIGDKPAPNAPNDPEFHFTPFGAFCHSSLWLNCQLEAAKIPERKLTWINSADVNGTLTNPKILHHNWAGIIALGGNAAKWVSKAKINKPFAQVQHPQAWKRFHSKEHYPLISTLEILCKGVP